MGQTNDDLPANGARPPAGVVQEGMHIRGDQISMPLFWATRTGESSIATQKFIGSAMLLEGRVCTCKHVVDLVPEGQILVGINEATLEHIIFPKWQCHPKYDFAVLTSGQQLESLPMFANELHAGFGVQVRGYHLDALSEDESGRKRMAISPRVFAGNIVRLFQSPSNLSRSINELSFATLSGLSGAPVLIWNPQPKIIGMVYGNHGYDILVHQFKEVVDGSTKFSESINRIVEFGMFHSVGDLKSYLLDMGIS